MGIHTFGLFTLTDVKTMDGEGEHQVSRLILKAVPHFSRSFDLFVGSIDNVELKSN